MEQYVMYLDETIARLKGEEAQLAAEQRKDEGNLIKVRINVVGICKTILPVLSREAYETKLEDLRNSWTQAMELAKAHGDVEKQVVEEIKLQTLNEVKEKYSEVGGR